MKILFNSETLQVQQETTIAVLLEELNLVSRNVAVEVNQEVVPRGQHSQHVLKEGDQLEVVTLVGGG